MRSLKKIVVILVLIVAGLALAWNFSEPPPLPEESISVTVLANGPYEVGTHEYTLADASRPTRPTRSFPARLGAHCTRAPGFRSTATARTFPTRRCR